MRRHPYLRAYMAGLLIPSWVLLVVLAAYVAGHFANHLPAGLERLIIFPMAVVPNLWGIWNTIYVALGLHRHLSIGAYGALLPLLLMPAGLGLTALLHLRFYTVADAALLLPAVIAAYYLLWNYGVSAVNRIVDLP